MQYDMIKKNTKGRSAVAERELTEYALKLGFSNAKTVKTEDIVFDPSFRPYCAENICGQYGANYSCPPDCGTPEEMKSRVVSRKKALILESLWKVADYSDMPAINKGKSTHNRWGTELLKYARSQGIDGFFVGASGCSLCSPCEIQSGKPCRFPVLRWSCMSAYCIYVKKLADLCGMDYAPRPGLLTFYGMLVFD